MTARLNEERIERCLCEAICKASHEKRRQGFENAFRLAMQAGLDGWALLCRGFENWIRERYAGLNNELEVELESLAHDWDHANRSEIYWDLCKLLFAHTKRRLADTALDENRFLYVDHKKLCKYATLLTKEAREIYTQLLNGKDTCDHVKAVCAHSLGNLELSRLRVKLHSIEGGDPKYRTICKKSWKAAEKWYRKSIRISEFANISYAPPYNRLAVLELRRADIKDDIGLDISENGRINHLKQAIEYAERAIQVSSSKEPGTDEPSYAPPLLHKAKAVYWKASYEGQTIPYKDVAELLRKAVDCSPYDDPIRGNIEGFSAAIREEIDGTEDQKFYLQTRLAYPIQATESNLKRYFRGQQTREVISDLAELVVLRRWSSYSPLLASEDHETIGGGYLFQWQSHRVAVDPGVGFIRNLHQLGYNACDLDTIIMTHQHVDHCADFEPLLSFFKTHGKSVYKQSGLPKEVAVLYTLSGKERWKRMLLQTKYLKERDVVMKCGKPVSIANGCIQVQPTPLYGHLDAVDEAAKTEERHRPTGKGLVCKLQKKNENPIVLGFTSDTGYATNQGKRISDHFQECDIVVIHVSTIADLRGDLDPEDAVEVKQEQLSYNINRPRKLYNKHLGFWGTASFICDLVVKANRSNRTILLSEFGEEMLGSRPAILEEIRRVVASLGTEGKKQAEKVYIADVGTRVDLSTRSLLCQCGGNVCREPAAASFELETYRGDITMPHRMWSDRGVIHLCQRHARYAQMGKRGCWPLIGDFSYIREISAVA